MNLLNPTQIIKKLVLVISIVCLASCSTSTPEGLKVIPKDTGAVSVVDMYSLFKKGNLQDLEELSFFKTIRKEVRNEDKRIAKFIDDLMENPKSTGVDFTKDLFMFYVNEAKDEEYFCMSLDIANQEDFSPAYKPPLMVWYMRHCCHVSVRLFSPVSEDLIIKYLIMCTRVMYQKI